jgi:hypothetical protein
MVRRGHLDQENARWEDSLRAKRSTLVTEGGLVSGSNPLPVTDSLFSNGSVLDKLFVTAGVGSGGTDTVQSIILQPGESLVISQVLLGGSVDGSFSVFVDGEERFRFSTSGSRRSSVETLYPEIRVGGEEVVELKVQNIYHISGFFWGSLRGILKNV